MDTIHAETLAFALRGKQRRPCIVVQHRSRGMLAANLPAFPKGFAGFNVVHEVERIQLISRWADKRRRAFGGKPHSAWPGWPGSAVEAEGLGTFGTLGCFVEDDHARGHYALTCEHVVCGPGGPVPLGTLASTFVRSSPERRLLGQLARFGSSASPLPAVDAALIQISNRGACRNVIPRIGRLSGQPVRFTDISLGTYVCKYGASSDFAVGIITGIQSIDVMWPGSPSRKKRLESVLEITPAFDKRHRFVSFCANGDSGATVAAYVEGRNHDLPAFGQLIAVGTLLDRGYALSMDLTLQALNVRICC